MIKEIKDTGWMSTEEKLPKKGTLVSIMVKKGICLCQGYQKRNCYYEEEFHNVPNQNWVKYWGPPLDNY